MVEGLTEKEKREVKELDKIWKEIMVVRVLL